MNVRRYLPLAGFVVPTVIIGYGFVIPRSCIAGVNELTIGFATSIVGACVRASARTCRRRSTRTVHRR
jgi:hypothetical protein